MIVIRENALCSCRRIPLLNNRLLIDIAQSNLYSVAVGTDESKKFFCISIGIELLTAFSVAVKQFEFLFFCRNKE